jgi:hypothetical protein
MASWQNVKLAKWQVNEAQIRKLSSWQNINLTNMPIWWIVKLTKRHTHIKLAQRQVGKTASWHDNPAPIDFSVHLKFIYPGNTKGGSITVLLTSCLTGVKSAVWQLTIFVFYLQNRLIQTSQTGGQQYSNTSPFSIPWPIYQFHNSSFRKSFAAVTPDDFTFAFSCFNLSTEANCSIKSSA